MYVCMYLFIHLLQGDISEVCYYVSEIEGILKSFISLGKFFGLATGSKNFCSPFKYSAQQILAFRMK